MTANNVTHDITARGGSMSANVAGLDKATQQAIGRRLEWMYHTARAIHELASQIIARENSSESNESNLWAIQELAKGQARDLEVLSDRLQGPESATFTRKAAKVMSHENRTPSQTNRAKATCRKPRQAAYQRARA